MKTILTVDVGTTAVKISLFSGKLELIGFSCIEYSLSASDGKIVELAADVYWDACCKGIRKVTSDVLAKGDDDICAVAVTTQGETLVPVDADGLPLMNAIVWLDARADDESAIINSQISPESFYRTTGIPHIGPACPVSKLLWIKNKEPLVYARTYKFLLLLDFLLFKLTGQYVTDHCILSSTGYYDINRGCYWDEMINTIGIDSGKFPEPADPGGRAGLILDDVAAELGINRGAAIITCGMDQAASAVGAGNIAEGIVTETTGTALVVAATTDFPDFTNSASVYIMRHAVTGKYLILPYNATAGILMKWFKDNFCQQEDRESQVSGRSAYALMDDLAAAVPAMSGGLVVLPHFAGMLAPEVDHSAQGVFFGVGLGTQKAHFIRAILEGVAFMLKENLDMLESTGLEIQDIRSSGGGAGSDLWMQIKADVCQKTFTIMEQNESTSLGAAILAAVSEGMYADIPDACEVLRVRKCFMPEPVSTRLYEAGYARYRELYRRLKGLF